MGKRRRGVAVVAPGDPADSPVPTLMARLFSESPLAARRRIIASLIGVAGPLALAALADGRFARFLFQSTSEAIKVSFEDVRRLTEGQVLALARYAWEACPEVFDGLARALATEDPSLLRTFTGALFLLALSARGARRRAGRRE
jgi:hypothetical protein